MPQERRYSRYRQADVWAMLVHFQDKLKVEIIKDSMHGSSVSLVDLESKTKVRHRAVVLDRSSSWYTMSLNCTSQWDHGITAAVVGTHDSCLPIPVWAMDVLRKYEPFKMRDIFGPLQPTKGPDDKAIPDKFEEARRTRYGHAMLLGALMCGRDDALARLETLPPSTQFRIAAEVRKLHTRRPGRPLLLAPDPDGGKAELSIIS